MGDAGQQGAATKDDTVVALAADDALGHQAKAVIGAPCQVAQCRSVPQSAEHHGQHQVQVGPRLAFPVAAQRYVEILHEELRERDVPSFPELTERGCDVREVEVRGQSVAEEPRHADGYQ